MARPKSPSEGAAATVRRIQAIKQRLGLSDAELARLVGSTQSSVFRALTQERPGMTPSLKLLREFADSQAPDATRDSIERALLHRAAEAAWDGTPDGLRHILRLLETVGEMQRAAARAAVRGRKR